MLKFSLKNKNSILIHQKFQNDQTKNNFNKITKNLFSNKSDLNSSPGEIINPSQISSRELLAKERNIFYHLNERNLISNISNKDLITNQKAAQEFLKCHPRMYIGFDPTAESLHLGNLVGIITALRFASFGVCPIFLLGGATGQIGDPSGKNKERPLLEIEKVKSNLNFINTNIKKILKSISEFKDFKSFQKINLSSSSYSESSDGEVLDIQKILRHGKKSENDAKNNKNVLKEILNNNTSYPRESDIGVYNSDTADFVQEAINQMKDIRNLINAKNNPSTQLSIFHNIKCEIIDNMEFYKDLSIVDFLRNVGTSLRMGPMLSRESIKHRINSTDGMSLTEFMYQTFQGYDFLKLFELFNVRVQIGGSDQWGNMLAGYELIKKNKNVEVVNMTFPLLTTSNGQKFGKSEGNAIFINEHMTPINNIYQYFYNVQDNDLQKLFYAFSFMEKAEIDDILTIHTNHPESRTGQKILAEKMVSMLFSEDEALKCRRKCETHYVANKLKVDGNQNQNIDELFKDMEVIELPINFLDSHIKISQLCVDFKLLETKTACRRLLQAGAIVINNSKYSTDEVLCKDMLVGNKYLVIKTGKKHVHVFSIGSRDLKKENKTNINNDYGLELQGIQEIVENEKNKGLIDINLTNFI